MTRIEPGDTFSVTYNESKTTDVVALNLRQKRQAIAVVRKIQRDEPDANPFELMEEVLRMVMPNITDEFIDTLDENSAMEIVGAAIGGQSTTDEDKKKYESQP